MHNHASPRSIARSAFVAIFFCAASSSFAQAGDAQLALLDPIRKIFPRKIERFSPGGPVVEETSASAAAAKPVIARYRSARRVSAGYEGFAIELAVADRPLLHDNRIFRRFGNVQYDRTAEGKYSYFILVPFSSKKSVESFFEAVIKPQVPDAKVVEYKIGQQRTAPAAAAPVPAASKN